MVTVEELDAERWRVWAITPGGSVPVSKAIYRCNCTAMGHRLLTLGACARGLQYLLCVCVCLSVPSLLPSNGAYTTK